MPNRAYAAALAGICVVITAVAGWSLASATADVERPSEALTKIVANAWSHAVASSSSQQTVAPQLSQTQLPAPQATEAQSPARAESPVDLAAFGGLPATVDAPVSPARPSLAASLTALPVAVSPAPLQTVAASFAQSPLAAAMPGLETASSLLDGPAASDPTPPAVQAEERPARARGAMVVAFDASEGTSLDPLRARAWDLNATQVLPPLTIR